MAQVWSLARRFVEEHQELRWDSRSSGMHLKQASLLLNPKDGSEAYTEDQVMTCLLAMKSGIFSDWPRGKTASVVLAVLWGNPPFIQRMKKITHYLPPKPPYYEKQAAKDWEDRYGAFIHDESH